MLGTGIIEAIRTLHITRAGAVKARTATLNELCSLLVTAPADLHDRMRDLIAIKDVGYETAAQLLITAGDSPDRIGSEAAPIPASSGKTKRHRLSRGGDRQANRALHT